MFGCALAFALCRPRCRGLNDISQVLFFCFWADHTRSSVATEEHVAEAIRLFHVSTLDAARSGITANLVVTPEMRAEIQVRELRNNYV